MGTPIEPPIPDYGNDCNLCTPALWAASETPKYIYAYFAGIISCGVCGFAPPNGQTFKLTQQPGSPCYWVHSGDVWFVEYLPDIIFPDKSQLNLFCDHGHSFFTSRGNSCPPEYSTYANDQAACLFLWAGAEGTGTIFWTDEMLKLIEAFGLLPGPNLFYELFNATDSDIVHKFADLYQRTNVKFKADH